MDRMRIGMIGLGGVATRTHLPILMNLPGVTVQAGAEINLYQAERTQSRFRIPQIYESYQTMLDQEQLDIVYVCLPNILHYEATHAALTHGLHVFCEKPMGISKDEARQLGVEALNQGRILIPGYYLRYQTNFHRARQIIQERRLGKILQIQGIAVHSGPYRGWDPKGEWYLDEKEGGVLYDWGSHLVDLIYFLVDFEMVKIYSSARKSLPGLPVFDNISTIFEGDQEILGSISLSWGARGNLTMIQIHGTAGSILVSEAYFEHRTPQGGGINQLKTYLDNSFTTLKEKTISFFRRQTYEPAHLGVSLDFLEAIRNKTAPRVTAADALRVHCVLEAIQASLRNEKPFPVSNYPLDKKADTK
jgi:predicted dehydrogenase